MANYVRKNGFDQALDIIGSLIHSDASTLAEEAAGLGAVAGSGLSVTDGVITTTVAGVGTIASATLTFANVQPGMFVNISGDGTSANNGAFLITEVGVSSFDYVNAGVVASTAVALSVRNPYSLEDDLNFARTDRKTIKGTTNYYDPLPTFTRADATGTAVSASLANLAGKTTDAQAIIVSELFRAQTVASTNTKITLTSSGNLKHVSATDKTGIPCYDVAGTPYTASFESCYVIITNPATDNEILSSDDKLVFGVTTANSTTSPDEVDVVFYKVALGADLSTAVAYTWEAGLPTTINLAYPKSYRLDQVPPMAFRRILTLGIMSDADLRNDVDNLQTATGIANEATNIDSVLTNKANYYPFSTVGATPTVVDALNALNDDVGNMTFTGTALNVLTGAAGSYTITSALQTLAAAIQASATTRVIERISTLIPANTSHVLPSSLTYALDGSNNGANLWVYLRGALKDPGTIANGDDYAEVDTTHIKFFTAVRVGDHINYFKRQ